VVLPVTLIGLRILVVEDEMIVSLLIEEVLTEQRCDVIGPFGHVADALRAAQTEVIDFALLDVNVDGEMIYPVAEALVARNIPFLLLTGYGRHGLPHNHQEWPVCSKPFRPGELVNTILKQLERVA